MQRRTLVMLGLVATLGLTMAQAMAHSTIYTDDLGRMHFLGRDPGVKTLQKVEDFDNPAQKDVTDITTSSKEVNVNVESKNLNNDSTLNQVNASNKVNKTKASYSAKKGQMDAADPYTYGSGDLSTPSTFPRNDKKFFKQWW